MLEAIAVEWDIASDLTPRNHCSFTRAGVQRLNIFGGPRDKKAETALKIRLRGWIRNPWLKFTFSEEFSNFSLPWCPDV
jgi:hypothetical protein